MPYMTWLFKHLKWKTLYNEMDSLKRKYHYTKKSILKTTIYNALPWTIEKIDFHDLTKESWANKAFLLKNADYQKVIRRINRECGGFCYYDVYMNSFITLDILRHYGEFAQKTSLYSGVVIRGPTRDKRIIEFTRAIPKNQFTKDGCTRRLIREYMVDLMPEHVLKEKRLGRQSADLKDRILRDKEVIQAEWLKCFQSHIRNEYIDCNRAIEFIHQTPMEHMTDFQMVRMIYSCILLEYIDKYK